MARRKRKARRFGAVAMRPGRGASYRPKRFVMSASVMRTKGGGGRNAQYAAVVCPKLRSIRERAITRGALKRCGNGLGSSPTEALKRALAHLSRTLK